MYDPMSSDSEFELSQDDELGSFLGPSKPESLQLPTNYGSVIQRLEAKYKGSENSPNCLVDLQNLRVVSSNLEVDLPRKKAVYACADTSETSSEESDFEQENMSRKANRSSPNRKSQPRGVATQSRDTMAMALGGTGDEVRFMTPQYTHGPVTSLITYEPPSSSKIFDLNYQFQCLIALKKKLMSYDDDATAIRTLMEEKIQKTIGIAVIPAPGISTITPIISFDDRGEFHISMIFDSPPFTAMSSMLRQNYGAELLSLQREVYALVSAVPPQRYHRTVPPFALQQNNARSFDAGFEDDGTSETASQTSCERFAAGLSRRLFNATHPQQRTMRENQATLPPLQQRTARSRNLDQAVGFLRDRNHATINQDNIRQSTGDTDYEFSSSEDEDEYLRLRKSLAAPKRPAAVIASRAANSEPPKKRGRRASTPKPQTSKPVAAKAKSVPKPRATQNSSRTKAPAKTVEAAPKTIAAPAPKNAPKAPAAAKKPGAKKTTAAKPKAPTAKAAAKSVTSSTKPATAKKTVAASNSKAKTPLSAIRKKFPTETVNDDLMSPFSPAAPRTPHKDTPRPSTSMAKSPNRIRNRPGLTEIKRLSIDMRSPSTPSSNNADGSFARRPRKSTPRLDV